MKVKIDTKEKFHVITIEELVLSANMTEDLEKLLLSYIDKNPKNVILNFENVQQINELTAETLSTIQQTFYDSNCSLVICKLQPEVETFLDEKELLEVMNITPTESEAWDIVQMEEIERELF
ncbi:MAG: STAS domain-containing protein [Bacteroidota bacterium]|nr:STAS domain-containing protein [Bacteroidota bacterium]